MSIRLRELEMFVRGGFSGGWRSVCWLLVCTVQTNITSSKEEEEEDSVESLIGNVSYFSRWGSDVEN